MGTNYYLHKDACDTCNRSADEIHIGKSSGGWVFTLRIDNELGLLSLADWKRKFNDGKILDEYGEEQSPDEMMDIITNRKSWTGEPLRRHEIDSFCVAHGKGTWDLCKGEFC